MDKSGMKTMGGKYIPTTIDAIKFGKRYLDPADFRLKCLDIASLGIVIGGLVISFVCLF
jgi:hypothetical protein